MPRSYRPKRSIGVTALAAERDAVILGLRREGISQVEIARRMGISQSTVAKAIQRATRDLEDQTAMEARGLENIRYDWLERVMVDIIQSRYPVVNNGRVMTDPLTGEILYDPKPRVEAGGVMIRIWERRAKLNGMDKPAKQIIRHEHEVDADIERIIEAVAAASGLEELAAGREAAAAGTPAGGAYPVAAPKELEGPRAPEAAAS
jgi:DNA-binding CsgD family transcriptional regulator